MVCVPYETAIPVHNYHDDGDTSDGRLRPDDGQRRRQHANRHRRTANGHGYLNASANGIDYRNVPANGQTNTVTYNQRHSNTGRHAHLDTSS